MSATVDEQAVVKNRLPSVKNIVRYLSKTGLTNELSDPASEVDAYVGSWIDKGYTLISASFIESNIEGIGMVYVLVRK